MEIDQLQSDAKSSYEQKFNTLESKLDALLAYTQALEASQTKSTKESLYWQQRYEQVCQQQIELRQRLEVVVEHLKKLETTAGQ